jgi:hypothetical protein
MVEHKKTFFDSSLFAALAAIAVFAAVIIGLYLFHVHGPFTHHG